MKQILYARQESMAPHRFFLIKNKYGFSSGPQYFHVMEDDLVPFCPTYFTSIEDAMVAASEKGYFIVVDELSYVRPKNT
jgi:hypothetical protein